LNKKNLSHLAKNVEIINFMQVMRKN